jgi:5-methyltetrahydrofolate--homocysteine methyltransferase
MATAGEPLHALGISARLPDFVDVVGVNCVGPAEACTGVTRLATILETPRSAFPSGGVPGAILPPELFGKWIQRLVEEGVRLVGGCCGAGPEHIRAAAAVVGRER